MRTEPYYDKRAREWVLEFDVLNKDYRAELEGIPGGRIDPNAGKVLGRIDAIAAACYRLNKPAPKQPFMSWRLGSDESATLRPYQKEGVEKLCSILATYGGALLADDVGLGKTRQAAEVATSRGGRTLVVCPAAVRETWRAELARLAYTSTVCVLGPLSDRKYADAWSTAEQAAFVITSYELAQDAFEAAFAATMPRTIIIDEAHLLCGRDTRRANQIAGIASMCDGRLALTATPLWSRPRDLWRLASIVFGSTVFGTAYAFDIAYCAGRPGEFGGVINNGISRGDELRLRLAYYTIRRTKAQVASELPKLSRRIHWIEPTAKANSAFVKAMAESKSETAIYNALKASLEDKLDETAQLCADAGRFLCVTWLKDHAKELRTKIEARGSACLVITGEMDHRRRAEAIETARLTKIGIVATIDSIGTGVDGLQHVTSNGICHALDYVPVKMIQMEGRLDRLGQESPVQWTYVAMRESMDELVVKLCVEKLDQFRETLGGKTTEKERLFRDALEDSKDDAEGRAAALKVLYDSL